jgi:hypothetical protein
MQRSPYMLDGPNSSKVGILFILKVRYPTTGWWLRALIAAALTEEDFVLEGGYHKGEHAYNDLGSLLYEKVRDQPRSYWHADRFWPCVLFCWMHVQQCKAWTTTNQCSRSEFSSMVLLMREDGERASTQNVKLIKQHLSRCMTFCYTTKAAMLNNAHINQSTDLSKLPFQEERKPRFTLCLWGAP